MRASLQRSSHSPVRSRRLVKELAAQGWATTRLRAGSSLLPLARLLGEPVPSHRGGQLIDFLHIRSVEAAPRRSLSGKYGRGRFPFHTDSAHWRIPPRYLLLRLQEGTCSARPTLLASFNNFCASEAVLDLLEHEVWVVDGGRGRFLTSLLDKDMVPGELMLRFDPECMTRAERSFGRSAASLARLCRDVATKFDWESDVVLVIDNWRTLHGRGSAPGRTPHETRVLERVLIRSPK
jgi:hypothetical protein